MLGAREKTSAAYHHLVGDDAVDQFAARRDRCGTAVLRPLFPRIGGGGGGTGNPGCSVEDMTKVAIATALSPHAIRALGEKI